MPAVPNATVIGSPLVRRAARYPAGFLVMVSGPTIEPFTSKVSNISSSGVLLEHDGGLQVGDVIWVTLPTRKPVIGFVARLSRRGGAGVKFEHPIL